jgi:hypothetical protein
MRHLLCSFVCVLRVNYSYACCLRGGDNIFSRNLRAQWLRMRGGHSATAATDAQQYSSHHSSCLHDASHSDDTRAREKVV